ncbi:MAG: ferredoxin family protein [Chloroflexi bacterium]|nr:ferredoxin family protein [Chloroflexota bacterium]
MAKTIPADCKEAGVLAPVIDRNRCEAKADCVAVCPYDVLELRPVRADLKRQLSIFGRLKLMAHGGKQAFIRDPNLCHSCGQCVTACPEHAITLARPLAA